MLHELTVIDRWIIRAAMFVIESVVAATLFAGCTIPLDYDRTKIDPPEMSAEEQAELIGERVAESLAPRFDNLSRGLSEIKTQDAQHFERVEQMQRESQAAAAKAAAPKPTAPPPAAQKPQTAVARPHPALVYRGGQSWSWRGDLRSHLVATHGYTWVTVNSWSDAQCVAAHNASHEGRKYGKKVDHHLKKATEYAIKQDRETYVPRKTYTYSIQVCPNGVCPRS